MTMDDNELRRQFAELRDADKEHAPAFVQIYGRARARVSERRMPRPRRTPRVRPLVLAAAAAGVIVALSLAYGRSTTPSTTAPAIANWRAPTDVLLQTPGSELLGVMPALSKSILDEMIPTTSNKGT
jgi:ferric-dicitrate binding protein FerR (iron transport regulator)